jgi:hypothetical protein
MTFVYIFLGLVFASQLFAIWIARDEAKVARRHMDRMARRRRRS